MGTRRGIAVGDGCIRGCHPSPASAASSGEGGRPKAGRVGLFNSNRILRTRCLLASLTAHHPPHASRGRDQGSSYPSPLRGGSTGVSRSGWGRSKHSKYFPSRRSNFDPHRNSRIAAHGSPAIGEQRRVHDRIECRRAFRVGRHRSPRLSEPAMKQSRRCNAQ